MGIGVHTIIVVLPLTAIHAAAATARPFVARTPLLPVGEDRWLKLELLQPTGSFKVRGFFAAALALPEERRRRGLLTVSAGNAAMACAFVARKLGVPCSVVMVDTAPAPKLEGVRRLGAAPRLMPREELLRWVASSGWKPETQAFIHPFASPDLQAGNGGAGLEIVEDLPAVERVVVGVGGGGLIYGVASAVKALKPGVELFGVQSDGYELWPRVFRNSAPPPDLLPRTIADGTAAPYDASMHERLAESVDGWLTVPEPRLRAAVPQLASVAKVVAEGAGALAFAALEQLPPGPPTVALVSGGNIDRLLLVELLAPPGH